MSQKAINRCMIIVMLAVFSFLGVNIISYETEISDEVISEEVLLPEEIPDISNGFGVYDNAIDCYLAASAVLNKQVNYTRVLKGDVTAKAAFVTVNQKLRGNIEVNENGDVYFEEVTKAESSYTESRAINSIQKKDSKTIDVKISNKVNSKLEATYSGNYETKTLSEYKDEIGLLPLDEIYIVSNQTLKEVVKFEFDGEFYKIVLNLKTTAPVAGYKKKIMTSANAKSMSFKSCSCSAVVDKNGLLQEMVFEETYSISIGITANVTSKMTLTYSYK